MSETVRLTAPIVANVWQLRVAVGDVIDVGTVVAVLESMKMEIPIESSVRGTVVALPVPEGTIVQEGDTVADIALDRDSAPDW